MAYQKFDEITLQMPSGQIIAGKWYGNKSIRPILCLHGTEDNSGSFDRLIPLLSENFSYLAIDFPGHGRSSWIPNGYEYKLLDFLYIVDFIYKYYKWDKITLMGHSLGARLSAMYACLYPEQVDMLILFDILALKNPEKDHFQTLFHKRFPKFLKTDKYNQQGNEPPASTFNELVEKLVKATGKSVTKETAHYILDRNVMPSKKHPGKFYLSRDRRVQFIFHIYFSTDDQLELVKNLTMPVLLFRAGSTSYDDMARTLSERKLLTMLEHFPQFHHHQLQINSHHFHLTEPEKINSIINEFLLKHKNVKCHL